MVDEEKSPQKLRSIVGWGMYVGFWAILLLGSAQIPLISVAARVEMTGYGWFIYTLGFLLGGSLGYSIAATIMGAKVYRTGIDERRMWAPRSRVGTFVQEIIFCSLRPRVWIACRKCLA